MRAKVSVIMPSLNVADYIRECLDSVTSQSLEELEIICIDAGSTDGTKEILVDYAKRDSRIVLLHSDRKSYGRQVNMGLDYASGEYVAVLETDDWIEPDMYQYLYQYAQEEKLDYAAADFDMFWRLQSGADYCIRQRLFCSEEMDWYGKCLNSDQLATLRASDYVLWKGIYNREFLNTHHIRLHESFGAAFQDMGFLQQVKTYAKKAMYVDRSFYRYRQDRQAASSRGLEGLVYYEGEFRWINDKLKLRDRMGNVHKKYYYFTMSLSFITKYEQILEWLLGDWRDKRLDSPYLWFREQITAAIAKGLLEETMYGRDLWERLRLLLDSREAHSQRLTEETRTKKQKEQAFLEKVGCRSVIIFGCGIRGERMMWLCDKSRIDIRGFCDNNPDLHGTKKFGFSVISPEDLKKEMRDKNRVILLSMKNGQEQVCEQLREMGIEAERMIGDIPV